ncbi:glutathione S-transferase family protein [Aliiroseovarius sp. S1339]|uniref:glutathione S-transferase family protein n=1 Tax=Aliiroseovarius sp. S1339 TaxID=2936990 RepID=UPI0020C17E6B|nr:glutathione S-transferase family protein [Aliiroseovarius sp. S1339]MCK8464144.1 glutathione S-transferase family protein [Aliiroseovarius sp. S1339]
MSYTVIGPNVTRTFRVLWMLEELGQSYDRLTHASRSDDLRQFNPAGKVPVLLDGDAVLTDSTAIIQYLADKHGDLTFPAGTIERARQDGFTQFILDELDATLWTAARHTFVLPKEKRVPEVKQSLKWEFERSISELMRRKGDAPFLMGERMTVPDILATHCGTWAIAAGFPLENAAFRAYAKPLRNRPAYARAAEG